MPCNAIATARAQVSQPALLKDVPAETIKQIIAAYLPQYSAGATIQSATVTKSPRGETVRVTIGGLAGAPLYYVTVSGGDVRVEASSAYDPASTRVTADLAAKITQLLGRVGAAAMQKKIAAAIAARGGVITGQTTDPATGIIVMNVEV